MPYSYMVPVSWKMDEPVLSRNFSLVCVSIDLPSGSFVCVHRVYKFAGSKTNGMLRV